MVKSICLMLASALALASCSSSARTMSARGFQADVVLGTGTISNAELLSLQDGILMAMTDTLWIVNEVEIESVYLHIDQQRDRWIPWVAGFQVVPSIALMIRFGDEGGVLAGIGGLAVAGITSWAYLAAEPKQTYRWPLTADQMQELRLRMRYPYGIGQTQVEQLRMSIPTSQNNKVVPGYESVLPNALPGWQTMVLTDSSSITVTILEEDATRFTVKEESGSVHTIPKNAVVRFGPVGTVAVPVRKP